MSTIQSRLLHRLLNYAYSRPIVIQQSQQQPFMIIGSQQPSQPGIVQYQYKQQAQAVPQMQQTQPRLQKQPIPSPTPGPSAPGQQFTAPKQTALSASPSGSMIAAGSTPVSNDGAQAHNAAIRFEPGLEIICFGQFKLLFGLLRMDSSPGLQHKALQVISVASSNQDSVGDVANSGSLVHLLLLFHTLPDAIPLALSTLFTLVAQTKIVNDLLDYGGAMYVFDLLCNHADHSIRSCAAELLGKIQGDKLHGPVWTRVLTKFLPSTFMDAMRDSPKNCIQLFDMNAENPELIWNDSIRETLRARIKTMKEDLYQRQMNQADFIWKLPDDFRCVYEDTVSGQLVIAGVFIRLYVANPSWTLRNPRLFLTELVEQTVREMRTNVINDDKLELLTTALVGFLYNQPVMCDQVAAQGYIPRICEAMKSGNKSAAPSSVLILQQIAKSKTCVESLVTAQCLSSDSDGHGNQT